MRAEIWWWLLRWALSLAAAALCSAATLKLMDILWWKPRRIEEHFAKQGIRGPPYHFFIGNLREMVSLMLEATSKPMMPRNSHKILPRVLSFYHHWKKIYGSTFLLWFGPNARLVIADPDLIREILIARADFFDRYESHPLIRQLEGEGLVSLRGEKWVHHRKVLNPTFYMDNLKLLVPTIGKTVAEKVEKWAVMLVANSGGEVEIDVSDWFDEVTEDAITRTAFGRNYEDGNAVFRLQAQQMAFASEAFKMVLIPGYRFLPTKKNTSSWKLDKEIRRNLVKLIGRRKEAAAAAAAADEERKADGAAGVSAKDLLGVMINASRDGQRRVGPPQLAGAISVRDIVEECKTFFFAGKQTTSNLLTWTTVLLAMHPEWQESARCEVLQICGSNGLPTRDQLARLKTLGMILNETMRLYPPVVATIRQAMANVELGRYKIPQGTELLIPIIAVHHDAQLWGVDVAQFNPARFVDGVARAARHPTAFIPFGLGARMCIGQNLALLEAKLTLAIILQRFSFRLSPDYVHAPAVLMLLHPQHGAPILFRTLSSFRNGSLSHDAVSCDAS